jgi:hypothetical protein
VAKLAAILDRIDWSSVLLPEFQRGYVWNRDQVRELMRSLYRGYPVGGLLTWEIQADGSLVRCGLMRICRREDNGPPAANGRRRPLLWSPGVRARSRTSRCPSCRRLR